MNKNTSIGILLFLIYCFLYFSFVLLNAFAPELMSMPSDIAGGLNFAVVFGMALIFIAFFLSILYGVLCRPQRPAQARASSPWDDNSSSRETGAAS